MNEQERHASSILLLLLISLIAAAFTLIMLHSATTPPHAGENSPAVQGGEVRLHYIQPDLPHEAAGTIGLVYDAPK